MTNVLYIGNNLKSKHSNVSSIQTLGALLETEDYKVYYASNQLNKVKRLLDMVFTFFKYRKIVDVVIIDTYSTQNFYFALVISQLCRLFKMPYIPSLKGGNLESRLKHSALMSQLVFSHAKVNVSPSLFLQHTFSTYGYTNVQFIPNTIALEQYEFTQRSYATIRLLWVRSLSKIYNPELAVTVLKKLQDQGYDASLCMVGPDTGDGSLESVKALATDLDVSVRFTGKLSKTAWRHLSVSYNIFINTTHIDNTPVSVIEAMALGLPIVSTNVGGMPYLISDKKDGLLVAPDDADAMVAAIIELYTNRLLRTELILKGREKVEAFDWTVVKSLWKSVLSQ
ncbi:glycosyltransferase family 4 protein [Lacinutrix undariae]